jgi:sigma-E factor negative regulatory protein RseA
MEDQFGESTDPKRGQREQMSALLDGELPTAGVREACAAWRDDASVRDTWHAYSVIGDAMRSADLAAVSARDGNFLRDLRARMATEPVVIAPRDARVPAAGSARAGTQAPTAARARGRSWWSGAVAAAGLVVVIGSVVVNKTPAPVGVESATVAPAPTVTPPRTASAVGQTVQTSVPLPAPTLSTRPQVVAAMEPAPSPGSPGIELVSDGSVIRDPQLDRYLLAHKQFSGSSVLGAPSGFLRNAAIEFPAR